MFLGPVKLIMNIEDIKKLGLGGSFKASTTNDFTDRSTQLLSRLKDIFLDIENIGIIKNIKPRLVLRKKISEIGSNNSMSTSYATWKMPIENEKYYFAKYKLFAPAMDILGIVHFGNLIYRPEDNSYFRKSLDLINQFKIQEDPFKHKEGFSRRPWDETHGINVDGLSYQESGIFRPSGFARNDLDFARISFPKNVINTTEVFKISLLNTSNIEQKFSTCSVTGYATVNLNPENLSNINSFFNTGTSGSNIKAALNKFTSSLYTKNYLTANNNILSTLSGEFFNPPYKNTGNYNNYMIPYPNTVDLQNFYKFNIPTKICLNDNYDELCIKGLLVVSTGNPLNGTSKICYVSPHVIVPKTVNIIEDFVTRENFMQKSSGINKLNQRLKYQQEIFQTNILSLTSAPIMNISGGAFGAGLQNQNISYNFSGVNYFENRKVCATNGHLIQSFPLKDTPFYKFYSGLYTGAKKLNTGVWNGYIPSGVFINVELITNTFGNEPIGLDRDLVIVYSGQGSMDNRDMDLFQKLKAKDYRKYFPRVEFNIFNNFAFESSSTSYSSNIALSIAKTVARQFVNKMITKILRLKTSYILSNNNKSKKFIKYKNLLQNKLLYNNKLNKINNYISNIQGGSN